MTSSTALSARLRKIERSTGRQASLLPCTVILTESDEDEAQQLTALEAAGTYKPGWPIIAWCIVDPIPRKGL